MTWGNTLSKGTNARLPGIRCPHCGHKTITRTSEQVTPMVRELRLVCANDECNASFVAQLSFIRELRRSAMPRPGVALPVGPAAIATPANENAPLPANDDVPPAAIEHDAPG